MLDLWRSAFGDRLSLHEWNTRQWNCQSTSHVQPARKTNALSKADREQGVPGSASTCASVSATTGERTSTYQATASGRCTGSRFAALASETSDDEMLHPASETDSEPGEDAMIISSSDPDDDESVFNIVRNRSRCCHGCKGSSLGRKVSIDELGKRPPAKSKVARAECLTAP